MYLSRLRLNVFSQYIKINGILIFYSFLFTLFILVVMRDANIFLLICLNFIVF